MVLFSLAYYGCLHFFGTENYLNMTLEQKREFSACGPKDFKTLSDIPTWPEYYANLKTSKSKSAEKGLSFKSIFEKMKMRCNLVSKFDKKDDAHPHPPPLSPFLSFSYPHKTLKYTVHWEFKLQNHGNWLKG